MSLMRIENLRMYYGTTRGQVKAVDDISLNLRAGQALGLAGESGCGKSSLALTLLRILPKNGEVKEGRIAFDGQDLLSLSDEEFRKEIRWKKIAMVFQGAMNSLNPVLRIGDQIAEAILNAEEVSKKKAKERTASLLDRVGINPGRAGEYPHQFSGGMKQRAVIAMALACNPDLIIADEPTTALDVMMQAQVLKSIQEIRTQYNLSMILISHDLSVIAQTCDQVAVMYAGRVVEYGTAEHIFNSPVHPYTRGLLSAFPDIMEDKQQIASIPGTPPDLVSPPSGCRFLPRCSLGDENCGRKMPELTGEDEHQVACFKAAVSV